jgi:uncharacterized membrane protein YkoI
MENQMNARHRMTVILASLGLALAMPLAHAAGESQDALKAEAKVTEQDARTTALAKVPQGTIKSSALEKEHGRLVWSFDIAQPMTQDLTEVQVDAKTGKVVSVEKETPATEAKEQKGKPQATK